MKVGKIVICTHGSFGEEMIKSAEMIVGELQEVKAFPLLPNMSPEEYSKAIAAELEKTEEAAIVLTDMMVGTPFNVAAMLSREYNISIVTGLNLPMLLEVYDNLGALELEELEERAKVCAENNIRVICRQ